MIKTSLPFPTLQYKLSIGRCVLFGLDTRKQISSEFAEAMSQHGRRVLTGQTSRRRRAADA